MWSSWTCRKPAAAAGRHHNGGIGSVLDDNGGGGGGAKRSVLHRVRSSSSRLRACKPFAVDEDPAAAAAAERRVVLYFTSIRAVRPTFEDCREVCAILRGLRVAVDERDVSLDAAYLAELRALMRRDRPQLPQLFVGGRLVGNGDDVRLLHESGELRRVLAGAPLAASMPCPCCGGSRFVPCSACGGSHRRFSEKMAGFRVCTACNENGLLQCTAAACSGG